MTVDFSCDTMEAKKKVAQHSSSAFQRFVKPKFHTQRKYSSEMKGKSKRSQMEGNEENLLWEDESSKNR